MKKLVAVLLIALLVVPILSSAGLAKATVEVVCDDDGNKVGQRIYVPGKEPSQKAAVDNPASTNPIEVAGL